MDKTIFEVGEKIKAVKIDKLPGRLVAPPLELDKEYEVKRICLDSAGNQHLDVGLISKHNYIESHETEEDLPDSSKGKIHWCHPSRFVKVRKETN